MTALVVLALAFAQVAYCAPPGCGYGPFYPAPYPGPEVIEFPVFPGYPACPDCSVGPFYPEYPVFPGPGLAFPGPYPGAGVIEFPYGPGYPEFPAGPFYPEYPVFPGPYYPGYPEYPAGPFYPEYPVFPGPYYPGYPEIPAGPFYPEYPVFPGYGLEEGCCPGPVIEKKTVIEKPVTIPYSFTEPIFSKKCFQKESVSREVLPNTFESAPVCETLERVTKLPSTDITTIEQPLCKKTCTTSEYVIQIPIVETTCTSSPLCKKTVLTQDNLITNVAKQTSCAKQVCTQNKVIEQPFIETVCQNFEGGIIKSGSKTILKPEVVKSCVQLPPYKCLKPAPAGPILYEGPVGVAYGGPAYVEGFPFPGPYGCGPDYFPAPGCSYIY